MTRFHQKDTGELIPFTSEEEAAWDALQATDKDRLNAKIKELREAAYKAESDSLFFKFQRGEATMQDWQNKVAEIKARFPYQE
jgi:hypothetical protein